MQKDKVPVVPINFSTMARARTDVDREGLALGRTLIEWNVFENSKALGTAKMSANTTGRNESGLFSSSRLQVFYEKIKFRSGAALVGHAQ